MPAGVNSTAITCALVLTGSLAALEAAGETRLTAISPVFHQLVMFSVPPEFKSTKATIERTTGAFYMREQVPEGESIDRWTRMISLTATRDLASNPSATPQAMLARMASGFQRNCPESFSTAAPGPQKIHGYDAYEVIASCGHVQSGKDAYSESAVMLTIKGANDYYTLQWTERGRDSAQPVPIDMAYWTKQLARLNPIRLCPIVPGEAAPYPSCAAR